MMGDEQHLRSGEVAAFIDGGLTPGDRARVAGHLASCSECRSELAAAVDTLRTAPSTRRTATRVGLAAAVLALILLRSLPFPGGGRASQRREPSISATAPPVAIAPRGSSLTSSPLIWTRVSGADRYRVQLLDSAGTAIWHSETDDTAAALPDSVRLSPGASYFWRVEARTGWERWLPSELQYFTVRSRP